MHHAEVLMTFAEVGVAFAGFASLIGLLGRSSEFIDASRLLGMVRTSLLVTCFSLVPFIPNALGLSGSSTWRLAGVSFFVVAGVHTFFSWRVLYRTWQKGLWSIRAGYFTFPMGAVSLLLALVSAIVGSEETASGFYLASLAALLSVSGVLFLSVFTSFVSRRPDEPAD
jgi:hypothetical protein